MSTITLEDLEKSIMEDHKRVKLEAREAIAAGKEPFDYQKFVKFYAHDTGSYKPFTGNESESTQFSYEREYYSIESVNTVEEYADYLNELENSNWDIAY